MKIMIRKSIEIGTKVWHELFGIGTFMGFETKKGLYNGFAFVEFETFPRRQLMHPKMLTEIEE